MRPILLLTAMVLGVTAPAAHARPRLCDDRPGETVAATSVVRVFRDARPGADVVVRGCRHGSRTVTRMAVDGDCMDAGSVGQVVAAGRYAALTRTTCDTVSGSATVVLFDLKAGRDLLGAGGYAGDRLPGTGIASTAVPELALAPSGALAWIGQYTEEGGVRRASLQLRRPGQGAPEVLVTRADDALRDLALTGARLYWLEGDEVRSATV